MAEQKPLILAYSATTAETISRSLGEPEYSYYFVLKAFAPVLQQLGELRIVADPATEVDAAYRDCRQQGRHCLFLSFCPPDQLNLELECPTIPVFAWEFENIPNEIWDEDPKTDWRYVLGRAGWAITHSSHTVSNVQKNVRRGFPIVSAPAPMWDHYSALDLPRRGAQIDQAFEITVNDGFLIDTRAVDLALFSPEHRCAEHIPPAIEQPATLELDGVVYSTILNPRDGRKNWMDIIWTFCWAFKEEPGATLVVKLTCYDAEQMIDVLLYDLYKLTPFQCRVVALSGYLPDESYEKLAACSTFAVNASRGEGQCLPLMEYMSCGVPAVSPCHTGLLDYIHPGNAFIVDTSLEPSHWPHDPRQYYRTLRHRVDWESLLNAFQDSFRTVTTAPETYRKMSQQAVIDLEKHCSAAVITPVLEALFNNLISQFERYAPVETDSLLQRLRQFWRKIPGLKNLVPDSTGEMTK